LRGFETNSRKLRKTSPIWRKSWYRGEKGSIFLCSFPEKEKGGGFTPGNWGEGGRGSDQRKVSSSSLLKTGKNTSKREGGGKDSYVSGEKIVQKTGESKTALPIGGDNPLATNHEKRGGRKTIKRRGKRKIPTEGTHSIEGGKGFIICLRSSERSSSLVRKKKEEELYLQFRKGKKGDLNGGEKERGILPRSAT